MYLDGHMEIYLWSHDSMFFVTWQNLDVHMTVLLWSHGSSYVVT